MVQAYPMQSFETAWPISAFCGRRLWVVFCRSLNRIVLVKSDAIDWSGRMQTGGQVRATIHTEHSGDNIMHKKNNYKAKRTLFLECVCLEDPFFITIPAQTFPNLLIGSRDG